MKRFAILCWRSRPCADRVLQPGPQAFLFQRGRKLFQLPPSQEEGGLLQFQRTGGGRARGGNPSPRRRTLLPSLKPEMGLRR